MTSLDPSVQQQLLAQAQAAQQQQNGNGHAPTQLPQPTLPLDFQMFLEIFPILLQGAASKSANVQDAISSAMEGTRKALGQFVSMGIQAYIPSFGLTRLADGSTIAVVSTPIGAAQGMPQGINQPQGGMVQPGNFMGQVPTVQMQPHKVF